MITALRQLFKSFVCILFNLRLLFITVCIVTKISRLQIFLMTLTLRIPDALLASGTTGFEWPCTCERQWCIYNLLHSVRIK